jgi:flagellar hook-associated protein 2
VDGIFTTRTQSSVKALSDYEEKLEALDVRMNTLFERYMSQFSVMEALVSQLNTTRTSLSDTWMNMGNFNQK